MIILMNNYINGLSQRVNLLRNTMTTLLILTMSAVIAADLEERIDAEVLTAISANHNPYEMDEDKHSWTR